MPTFVAPLECTQNELRNAIAQVLGSAPSSPLQGQFYYNSSSNQLFLWDGSAWKLKATDSALLNAQNAAYYLSRAHHSGTQTASTISDFNTAVRTNQLDQMAKPTAAVAMNAKKIIGLANGSASSDAAAFGQIPTTLPPTGTAGGDLSGTYPNPGIAAGAINNADINASAAIALSKLATDPLARANHTGTQTASTISNFDTQVRTSRLDQMATASANVAMGSNKITNLSAGTTPDDAVNFGQMSLAIQNAAAGLDPKDSVDVATTANISLSGIQTIDGQSGADDKPVLVKNQLIPGGNGIYLMQSGAWKRRADAATGMLSNGALVLVTAGSTNAGTQWYLNTPDPITVGTTAQSWVQFGAGKTYTAGDGINLVGSAFSVKSKSGGGLIVDGGGVSVDTSVVARKYAVSVGDGTSFSFSITHGLATKDVIVQVHLAGSPGTLVEADWEIDSPNAVVIVFTKPPSTNQYRVVVIG